MDGSAIADLTRVNIDDMLSAFGLQHVRFGRSLLERICRPAARQFAETVLDFDRVVGESGLQAGSQHVLDVLKMRLTATGVENIPPSGALLIVSNHPGLADTVALFAGLPRRDIQVVALERPFLKHLPAVSGHLIYIPEDETADRMGVLRSISAHLRAGGTIVTFPAGKIEPDPASMPGAAQSLDTWSESTGFFIRMVAESCVVPVIISGVQAPQALHHPLTRLRRVQKDRERLAAALQLLVAGIDPLRWPVNIQVRFAPPLAAADLAPLRDPAKITRAVIDYTSQFLPVN